jgi:hypothetical protein
MRMRFTAIIGLAALAVSAPCSGLASAGTCSKASLSGPYGLLLSGTNSSGQPVVAVYQLNANGAGKISGSGTQNANGTVATNNFTATYTINAACAGTLNISGGDTFDFVLDAANKHMEVMLAESGKGVKSGFAVAQGTQVCSASGLSGTFSGTSSTPASGSSGPSTVIAQSSYNGAGKSTATGTAATGSYLLGIKVTGTYSVDPNCFVAATGKATITVGGTVVATQTSHSLSIMVNGGAELLSIGTDPAGFGATTSQK